MSCSEKKKKYDAEYKKGKVKRVPLDLNYEQFADLYVHCRFRGEAVNSFIKRAIRETIAMDERKEQVKEMVGRWTENER